MTFTIPSETRRRQRLATDPAGSAWVSANAGSGKTYVLTRRVIRLLLAGCDPGRILCLTFTKAAAAEMANRVFEALGEWTTIPDEALAREIEELEGEAPGPAKIAGARRLFARALETPGGLKVQTIHGFCEALLQRFSVEANLSGRFEVLDDRGAAVLMAEAKAAVLAETAREPTGATALALAALLADTTDAAVDKALAAMVKEREAFTAWIQRHGSLEAALAALPQALGVPAGGTRDELEAAFFPSPILSPAMLSRLIDVLDGSSSSMQQLGDCLRDAVAAEDPAERRAIWRSAFLTQKSEPKKRLVTKEVEAALPGTLERFTEEAVRLVALERAIAGAETAERTAWIARLGDRLIGFYQARKAAVGALDYDDLILRTAALLSRSDAALWVQYKLDEGLDHVLVDEAQDTSPKQWEIVEALAGDFFAGLGARGRTARTVFAVGDEKQSIYSFQGAAPRLFAESRSRFGERASGAGAAFEPLTLNLSFRSTPDVVKAVDRVFEDAAAHAGLSLIPERPSHETVRSAEPGLVEVWPETVADRAPEPERWEDPVDATGAGSADVRLANRVADEVAGWIERGERLPATGKRIRPGDILILVRSRGAFVEAVNRALKSNGVAIAGADRLDVVGHIVAQDFSAAARVALLPEDDLSLATVAKSPLVGLSEDDLFRLAHGRSGSLWAAVRDAAADGDAAASRLAAVVETWMRRAGRSDPHGFFAALAGPDGARAAYRARIGRESDEVIDEYLGLALAFEARQTATLQGFLALMAEAEEEVKREVEAGRDEVRVMTVHGAKGLEAPIVFLVDPGSAPASSRHDPCIVTLDAAAGGALVWVQPGLKPAAVEASLASHRRAAEEEYRRLLYVGLTRARDRLIVTGIKRDKTKPDGRWHTLVATALQRDAEVVTGDDGTVRCWRWRSDRDRPAHAPVDEDAAARLAEPLPGFLFRRAPSVAPAVALTPSSAARAGEAGDAERFPSRDALERIREPESLAATRGRLAHRLFEVLPEAEPSARRALAAGWIDREAPALGEAERAALLDGVMAVLDDARHGWLFGPDSRAEVGIAAEITDEAGRRYQVSGQIDRLVVTDGEIVIVDFKTNRSVPEVVPDEYVAQLALYRRVLTELRPGVPVRAAVLWTEVQRLQEVPAAALDAMLTRVLTNMGSRGAGRRS